MIFFVGRHQCPKQKQKANKRFRQLEPQRFYSIASVLNQTYQDIEIILVDDGSTDRSPEICDEYAKKDNRIKVIHKENDGANAARKTGFYASVGEFVCFLDSDDYTEPNFLETLYNEFDDETDMVISSFCVHLKDKTQNKIYEKRTVLKDSFAQDLIKPTICKLKSDKYFYDVFIWLRLYRRGVISDDCFVCQTEVLTEDLFFQLYATFNCRKIKITDKPLYHHCPNELSLTYRYYPNKLDMTLKRESLIRKFFEENNIDLEEDRLSGLELRSITGCVYNSFSQRNYKLFKDEGVSIREKYKHFFDLKKVPFKSLKQKITVFLLKYKLYFILYFILLLRR